MKKQTIARLISGVLFSGFYIAPSFAQQLSPAQEEVEKQRAMAAYPVSQWDSLRCAWYGECPAQDVAPNRQLTTACPLTKRMFGWHAIGTSSANYAWTSLSDLSYF